MFKMKRALCALLAIMLIISTAPAFAASQTVYVRTSGASVYNSKGVVIGTLSQNAEVELIAAKGNVCAIEKNGSKAFMKKADLSAAPVSDATEDVTAVSKTAYVCTDSATVYNAKGKALGTLKLNDQVTVTAVKDGICRVVKSGKTAYMRQSDLSGKKTEEDDPSKKNVTVYARADGTKVYDATGKVILTLKQNDAVSVYAANDVMIKVISGTTRGYMYIADVVLSPITPDTPDPVPSDDGVLKPGDSGDAVKKLQTRLKELGYFYGNIGGNYLGLTQAAVEAFQTMAKLEVTGICDKATLELLYSDKAPKNDAGTGSATPAKGTAKEMDWWTSDIQKIFAKGVTATITDVATGLAWREQRRGGTNHADVQPLTAADTATLKKVYGGTWSWNRRAIFVTINGVNYAASMNGMPHGGGSISGNNFNGHHCIHFTNSRTHGSNKVCSLHQNAIKKALAAKL